MRKFLLFLLMVSCCLLSLIACSSGEESVKNTIDFYISNEDVSGLEVKNIAIDSLDLISIVEKVVELNNDAISQETKVLNVEVIENIAYVNFSKDFDDSSTNSSSLASLKIKSIVNTLCLNPVLQIEKVAFLIDGELKESIGPISTGEPISPVDSKNKAGYN